MNCKSIQLKYHGNPRYIIDQMINSIMQSKYPDANTVIGDNLRGQIELCTGVNMSLCDTHAFVLLTYMGTISTNEYVIYECKYEEYKELITKTMDIRYPEAKLLGYFPTEFKDKKFRTEHAMEYISCINGIRSRYIDCAFIESFQDAFSYVKETQFFMAYHLFNDIDNPLEFINEAMKDNGFNFNTNLLNIFKILYENHLKKLNTIYSQYDYAKVMEFYRINEDISTAYMNSYYSYEYEDHTEYDIGDPLEAYTKIKSIEPDDKIIIFSTDQEKFDDFYVTDFNPDSLYNFEQCCDYEDTKCAIDNGQQYIKTTQFHFLSTDLFTKGYRVLVIGKDGYLYEIKLGKGSSNTDREIKKGHNIEKLFWAKEFCEY